MRRFFFFILWRGHVGSKMQINQAHDASAQLAAHWLYLAIAPSGTPPALLHSSGASVCCSCGCHFASWLMSYMRRFNTNFLCIFKIASRKPNARYLRAKTWSLHRDCWVSWHFLRDGWTKYGTNWLWWTLILTLIRHESELTAQMVKSLNKAISSTIYCCPSNPFCHFRNVVCNSLRLKGVNAKTCTRFVRH